MKQSNNLSVAELAEMAGVSRVTMYRYLKEGLISFQTDSLKNKFIERSEAERWLATREVKRVTTPHVSPVQHDTSNEKASLQRELAALQQLLQAKDQIISEQRERLLLLEDLRRTQTSSQVIANDALSSEQIEAKSFASEANRKPKSKTLLDRLSRAADAFLG